VDGRIRIVLEVTAPESSQVSMPDSRVEPGGLNLVTRDVDPDKPLGGGRTLRREVFVVEPYLPGGYAIGPLKVTCRPAGDDPAELFTVETDPVDIEVASLLPSGDGLPEIMDIAPLAELPSEQWSTRHQAALAAAVLAAACLAGYLRRRLKRRGARPAAAPRPAGEIACDELDRLLAERLVETGRINEFYTRLSDILRRYVERRFGFHTLVQTTEQFLADVTRDADFDAGHKVVLREFLSHCDLVKFAGRIPPSDTISDSVGTCRRFIDESRHPRLAAAGEVQS